MAEELKYWHVKTIAAIIGAIVVFSAFFFTFSLILAVQRSFILSAIAVICCLTFSGFVIYYIAKKFHKKEPNNLVSIHKNKLREAQRIYTKNFKAFKQGKISKEEMKEALRPYKYELRELGYPIRIQEYGT
jgi:hypothetical protein